VAHHHVKSCDKANEKKIVTVIQADSPWPTCVQSEDKQTALTAIR
jgi:hypothetical protein